MGAQRLSGGIAAGKIGLGQGGVNFIMANLMHKNRRPTLAAPQFRDQVMQALGDALGDRAQAQGTDRDFGLVHAGQEWRGEPQRQGHG